MMRWLKSLFSYDDTVNVVELYRPYRYKILIRRIRPAGDVHNIVTINRQDSMFNGDDDLSDMPMTIDLCKSSGILYRLTNKLSGTVKIKTHGKVDNITINASTPIILILPPIDLYRGDIVQVDISEHI